MPGRDIAPMNAPGKDSRMRTSAGVTITASPTQLGRTSRIRLSVLGGGMMGWGSVVGCGARPERVGVSLAGVPSVGGAAEFGHEGRGAEAVGGEGRGDRRFVGVDMQE